MKTLKLLIATIFLLSFCVNATADSSSHFQLKLLWSTSVGAGSGGYKLQPSYAKGIIYTTDYQGKVTAILAATGQKLWVNKLKMPITAGISVGDNVVAVVAATGQLLVLSAGTGTLLWHKEIYGYVLAAPAIAHNTIIVKTMNSRLIALNAQSGVPLWLHQHDTPSLVLQGSSEPQISGNTVIAGFADGRLLALELNSGNVVWNKAVAASSAYTEVQSMVDIDATPLIQNGIVYVASYQGKIVALNLKDGQRFWQYKMSTDSGLAANSSQVFVSDTDGVIWAFDSASGGVDWRQPVLKNHDVTGPAVMGDAVVVADTNGKLTWFAHTDGVMLGQLRANSSGFNTAPIVIGNTLYALSMDGVLLTYHTI